MNQAMKKLKGKTNPDLVQVLDHVLDLGPQDHEVAVAPVIQENLDQDQGAVQDHEAELQDPKDPEAQEAGLDQEVAVRVVPDPVQKVVRDQDPGVAVEVLRNLDQDQEVSVQLDQRNQDQDQEAPAQLDLQNQGQGLEALVQWDLRNRDQDLEVLALLALKDKIKCKNLFVGNFSLIFVF